MHLVQILALVSRQWTCVVQEYPITRHLGSEEKSAILISHALRHARKALQVLDDQAERMEHCHDLDKDKARESIAKSVVAAARLANLTGVTAAEIESEIAKIFPEKAP